MSRSVTSALTKAFALVVLAAAAWLVLKVALNVVAGVAWAVAGVLVLLAVVWALGTLRR
ncbi:MAG TPA: hypothetical protein VE528_02120 [Thermoleophilaceae bacterium]|nr:hypothetical protein [Thermoleophilaceae bacterium]